LKFNNIKKKFCYYFTEKRKILIRFSSEITVVENADLFNGTGLVDNFESVSKSSNQKVHLLKRIKIIKNIFINLSVRNLKLNLKIKVLQLECRRRRRRY
jgi:hypothetical protein